MAERVRRVQQNLGSRVSELDVMEKEDNTVCPIAVCECELVAGGAQSDKNNYWRADVSIW